MGPRSIAEIRSTSPIPATDLSLQWGRDRSIAEMGMSRKQGVGDKLLQWGRIRFIFTNKLSDDDKLLLAFDALVFSEATGREVSFGKIIHGDDHSEGKVKTAALAGEVRKCVERIATLLSSPTPPQLVLNRHCGECEFQTRCRQKAIETDDLSLLSATSVLYAAQHVCAKIMTGSGSA